MAKASISLVSITPKNLTTVTIKFRCSCKKGYIIKFNDDYIAPASNTASVRVYYSATYNVTGANNCTYVQMHPPEDPNTTELNKNCVYMAGGYYECTFDWTKPQDVTSYTKLYLQLRMQLYTADGGEYYKTPASYRSPKNNSSPIEFTTPGSIQPLFQIAAYSNPHDVTEDGIKYTAYEKEWVDFTDCVELPSYDVNYEDVNEDWEDANYFTHRIKVRSKITGKLDLRFSDLTRYNQFIHYVRKSKECNGNGTAYVELKLQINDELNEFSSSSIGSMRCACEEGLFFIKMDSNPWVAPVFGHYDKYQAISLSINEA